MVIADEADEFNRHRMNSVSDPEWLGVDVSPSACRATRHLVSL
jgi:hypothetical protein